MKYITLIVSAALAFSASAITATKEYVDRRDAETLQAAKDYTDEHGGGGGGGGVNTNEVERIANRAVETNAVTVGLSSSVSSLSSSVSSIASSVSGLQSSKLDKNGVDYKSVKAKAENALPMNGGGTITNEYGVLSTIIAPDYVSVDNTIGGGNHSILSNGRISLGTGSGDNANIDKDGISFDEGDESKHYVVSFPENGGTFALTSDIPPEVEVIDPDDATETGKAADALKVKESLASTKAIVETWEGFLDGSNVVFSITNYISGTYQLGAAKLRILELRDGEYREVYNSRDEIKLHLGDFETNKVNVKIAEVETEIDNKADRDWGKYTSAGGIAPSNTVYMTAPSTVFAGGMEYERVAVGEGTVAVLATKGAPVYTIGDEGTFKFQDDGGTNYFGFAKTDSYVIGCDTDGISVQNQVVTLTYNVTMSGVPCIWYCPSLDEKPIVWEQLNTPDGQPIAGASHVVTWDENPDAGTEICYLNCPEPQGFFRATIEVVGSAKFMTNMPADLSGGILCTDGQHKVAIEWNNGSPRFVEVP